MSNKEIGAVAEVKSGEPAATKDMGRVRIGAGCIHFDDTARTRPETKDSGRTRIGAGCITF